MVRKHKINKYKYEFRNSGPEEVGVLYLFEGKELICTAVFMDKGELPEPREGLNRIVHVAYKFSWLQTVIDMLRFEKPIYFTWDDSSLTARISTDEEPVGEEEHRSLLKFLIG
jgi:hypothetical protein